MSATDDQNRLFARSSLTLSMAVPADQRSLFARSLARASSFCMIDARLLLYNGFTVQILEVSNSLQRDRGGPDFGGRWLKC